MSRTYMVRADGCAGAFFNNIYVPGSATERRYGALHSMELMLLR